jgi:predicted site-specific integrase-resolvase
MVVNISDYLSVKETAKLTTLDISTIYHYLKKGLIEGATKFAGTTWIIPKQWAQDYKAGKVSVKGAYEGRYYKYGKRYYDRKTGK